MNDHIKTLERQIEELSNLCDCDCNDDDCVRCAHYPAILEQKKGELDRARAAIAASRAAPDCHKPDLVTAAQVRTAWWCDACRSIGMVHCSDPEHCGFMRTCGQEADEWKSWLDDLPLHEDFSTGIDRLQDFITRIVAALDLTPAPAVEPVAWITQETYDFLTQGCGTACARVTAVHRVKPKSGNGIPLYAYPPAPTAQDAARVLLAAIQSKQIDPFDASDLVVEALAVKHAGNRGDAVAQLEIAEQFFAAALRAIGGDA